MLCGSGMEWRTMAPYSPYSAITLLRPQHFSRLRHLARRFWNHTWGRGRSSGRWPGRKQGPPGGCCAARLHRKPRPSGSEPPGNENPPRPPACGSTPGPEPPTGGPGGPLGWGRAWRSDSRPRRSVMAKPLDRNPEPCRRDLSIPKPGDSILTLGFSSSASRPAAVLMRRRRRRRCCEEEEDEEQEVH
ncbi:hypothetical protein EYF80_058243 [Liparis tanakae]|uniref:Uncharacterized protein n=1 Tax=Liparis tanakae TaxID=230148 RepID=A0A4Z2ETA2_9TELE|nr:hypothetical protein EYF80_058243 [Liparis tanakae]